MTRDDLTALIARVEAATADEQASVLMEVGRALANAPPANTTLEAWGRRWAQFRNWVHDKAFLDAALTLVPEEWGREFWHEPGEKAQGNVWPPRRRFPRWTCSGFAATPALALTAAALRARLAEMGDDA